MTTHFSLTPSYKGLAQTLSMGSPGFQETPSSSCTPFLHRGLQSPGHTFKLERQTDLPPRDLGVQSVLSTSILPLPPTPGYRPLVGRKGAG